MIIEYNHSENAVKPQQVVRLYWHAISIIIQKTRSSRNLFSDG